MPPFRRKSTTKAGTFTIHLQLRNTHAITHQVPSTEIRVRPSDGQRAHRCAMCNCTTVRRCTASTCSEVGLALRASWTTSWLAAPNGSLHTILMGRAHRLPRLRCRRSNSQLQRRTLSRSLERPQRSAASKRFAAGHPFQVSYVRLIVAPPKVGKKIIQTRHGPIPGAIR